MALMQDGALNLAFVANALSLYASHIEGHPQRGDYFAADLRLAAQMLVAGTPPPATHVAPAEHPIVSADRVYKLLKTYRDHGRFDWDHIGYICRDVAALATTEVQS